MDVFKIVSTPTAPRPPHPLTRRVVTRARSMIDIKPINPSFHPQMGV